VTILGAIDIGSNAMRLSVVRFTARGVTKALANIREPIRLGHDVFRLGRITPRAMDRAVAAIVQFKRIFEEHECEAIRAVGTSALRDAANGPELIERVYRSTGISLEVISGEEEARLIYLAVAGAVDVKRGSSLLVDIGGGSVELSLVTGGNLVFSDSTPMGTVRLLERLGGQRLLPGAIDRIVSRYAEGIRRQIQRGVAGRRILRVVGTGGNIEAFADLKRQLSSKGGGRTLSVGELSHLVHTLGAMSYRARIAKLGLRPDRADVIIPAGALLLSIMRESKSKVLVIPKVGLRDGVLIDLFQRVSGPRHVEPLTRRASQVVAYAREMGRRFSYDEQHALHASYLSLQLFEQTKLIHRLSGDAKILLEIAAILHDVGHAIDGKEHHKHSFYIIRETPFVGLSKEEKTVVALAARHHRGSSRMEQSPEWNDLSGRAREIALLAAAILRFVEALEKEHSMRISKLSVRRARRSLVIGLKGRGALLVERTAAEHKKDALEKALGVDITLE
jgi:exopolyphosphatase/guanosine-5'-triphosphate,3'-diphosphate pyrophosphatase